MGWIPSLPLFNNPYHFCRDWCFPVKGKQRSAESLETSLKNSVWFWPKVLVAILEISLLLKNSHAEIQMEVVGNDSHKGLSWEHATV